MRVLVTGASGFAGRYMCSFLGIQPERPRVYGIDIVAPIHPDCEWFRTVDVTDGKAVMEVVRNTSPDCIVHLVGVFGGGDAQETYRVNVLSMTALMEAVREHTPQAVVVAAGSAAEYGLVPEVRMPIAESTACQPVSPYGLSKLLATEAALYYFRTHGVQVAIARPFQLIGKGVTPKLAPGAFALQLAEALAGERQVVRVGNLDSRRDFIDVHDFTEAVWALCRHPAPGEVFNVCSGNGVQIGVLLEMMIEESGACVSCETDPSRLIGTVDASVVVGDYHKIEAHCGWRPRRDLRQSIETMFESES
ncbi:NAD-dependent epimerase/dehydratase family protein [Candidatus Bipolaricaulota bacterium]